jgi:hypothetical protein
MPHPETMTVALRNNNSYITLAVLAGHPVHRVAYGWPRKCRESMEKLKRDEK